MANRDLTNFRDVVTQVVENKNTLLDAGAEIAGNIIRQSQEAKINENMSQVTLDLNAMQNQYQIDYEGDPMGGLEKYKAERQKLFDAYGGKISPLYRRQWQDDMREVATRNDAVQQGWALKQTRVNTVNSINTSMKNNFSQASSDGVSFGRSDDAEIESFINFAASKQELEKFGNNNLGSETTAGILETYDEDYMKSFLSGVSEFNPSKALRLLENDMVRDSFGDHGQYMKMKNSLEARTKRFEKANQSAKSIGTLDAENRLGEKIKGMGYAAQQQYFKEHNVSPVVQSYYEEMSGYASQRKALSGEQKVAAKRKFNLLLSQTITSEDVSDGDLRILQDSVYDGMKKKVFTESEGFGFINQLMTPAIEKKRQKIAQFETGEFNPFQSNLGLDSLNKEIEKMNGKATADPRTIGNDDRNGFMSMANQMYDFYLGTLEQEAATRGTTIGGLSNLSFVEEQKIYNKALKAAKEGVIRSTFPEFATAEKLPATSVKPVPSIPKDYVFDNFSEAEAFAIKNKTPDGTPFLINGEIQDWYN